MAKQTINQGAAPTGAGGDTFRSGSAKLQANDNEIYNYLGDGTNLNKLGTAAFKNIGTGFGNVMEVGAFGLGTSQTGTPAIDSQKTLNNGFYGANALEGFPYGYGEMIVLNQAGWLHRLFFPAINNAAPYISSSINNGPWSSHGIFIVLNKNAMIDGNGFVKAASPVIKLFSNKIETNDEAQLQEITFEKLGAGDYLIKGSSGFAQEGWYIETPKDANGNLLVAVVYEQLANGDISVKTYDYMLNKKGQIIADIETPLDIPKGRWIDLRLQELPQPKIEVTDDPEQ